MNDELLKLLDTPEGAELIRKTLAGVLQVASRPKEYSPKRVAELAGVKPDTVRNWVRFGQCSADKRGKHVFIPQAEVDRLAACGWVVDPADVSKLPPSLRRRYSPSQSVAGWSTSNDLPV
jgi:hypothetical protein